jgi:tRNA modification GTPase
VGKSTLLNALLGEERAIVSDIQGTTRDTVEDTLVIDGMLFRFIDTAGMRQTDDQIENMGIERSRQAAQKAALIIHLIDATAPVDTLKELGEIEGKTVLEVWNKVDLIADSRQDENIIEISAKNGEVDLLIERLAAFAAEQYNTRNAVTISNTRHYEALLRAGEAIGRVRDGLAMQISGEFLSMDLQDCLAALGEITGQISSQEVLNNIFSKFCIGK